MARRENILEDTPELFTKETTVCSTTVTLHSQDNAHWFSDPQDIAIYLMRRQKTEQKLHPRTNIPMSRFSL
jgi:hypothetical protein